MLWNTSPTVFVAGKAGRLPDPESLYLKASKSVYELTAQANPNDTRISYGSAVAVTLRHALTNCHVIESGTNILMLIEKGGRQLRARLVGADPVTDQCVVESSSGDLAPVAAVRSFDSLREGERVYAIGNPRGLTRTISDGLLSGKRIVKRVRVIQTTAAISPGSSGGGLFDGAANLIGITTAFLGGSQNLNLAIPAEDYWPRGK